MLHKISALVLMLVLSPALGAISVQAQSSDGTQPVELIKSKVARLGVGEKARATVWTKDGRKLKGYIAESRETEFVLRDRKTDNPTIIAYTDVTQLDSNRGHSTARNLTLGIVVGAGAVLTTLAILIATLDD